MLLRVFTEDFSQYDLLEDQVEEWMVCKFIPVYEHVVQDIPVVDVDTALHLLGHIVRIVVKVKDSCFDQRIVSFSLQECFRGNLVFPVHYFFHFNLSLFSSEFLPEPCFDPFFLLI